MEDIELRELILQIKTYDEVYYEASIAAWGNRDCKYLSSYLLSPDLYKKLCHNIASITNSSGRMDKRYILEER